MLSYKSELLRVHVQQPKIARARRANTLFRHLEERDDESSLSDGRAAEQPISKRDASLGLG